MDAPLRLLLFDATCRGRGALPGLTASWRAGARLYEALGRIDAARGARTWEEGLEWLATVEPSRRVAEIQYWGHGQPGCILLDGRALDAEALEPAHPIHGRLRAIRARLAGADATWWFRTCSTFHGASGHSFASAWTRFFGCRAAGHTRVIGPFQGGLHSLAAGEAPSWSADEGARAGRILPQWLEFWAPRTVTCLHGRIPRGF